MSAFGIGEVCVAYVTERETRRLAKRTLPKDLFICGLDRIESIGGGMLRFVLFVNFENECGAMEKSPAEIDIVMPASALPDAIGKAIVAVGRQVFIGTDGSMTLLQ